MIADANIAATGALLADATRAQILLSLLDGRALTAGELASRARVTAPTASAHLGKLVEGGLLAVERQGRHRYYRLANAEVGRVLESLATISPPAPVRSLKESQVGEAVRYARTCYDHLAGRLGVQLTEAMVRRGLLVTDETRFDLTPSGNTEMAEFGLDIAVLRRQRRAFAPCCLDWSERRHHVAGALGAALAQRCMDLGWIRPSASSRAVQLTADGRLGLASVFWVEF